MAGDDKKDDALIPYTEEDVNDVLDRVEEILYRVVEAAKHQGDNLDKLAGALAHLDLPKAVEQTLQVPKDAVDDAVGAAGAAGEGAVKAIEVPVGAAQDVAMNAGELGDAVTGKKRRAFTLRKRRK